jgi:hypothetical protein
MVMKKWLLLLLVIGVFPYSLGYAASPNDCIELKNNTFKNLCGEKVTVRWTDAGRCSSGCAVYIPAFDKHKMKSVNGKVKYASCFYPAVASGDWMGSGKYTCK